MCVNFTYLNKVSLKDIFPLPLINQLVDAMKKHITLSFLDAYSAYNQIYMYVLDLEKTSFVTDQGLFCLQSYVFWFEK